MVARRAATRKHDGLQLALSATESGYEGVASARTFGMWQARLTLRKGERQTDLGTFDTPLDGAIAVAQARLELQKNPDWRPKEKVKRDPRGSKRTRCAARSPFPPAHSLLRMPSLIVHVAAVCSVGIAGRRRLPTRPRTL